MLGLLALYVAVSGALAIRRKRLVLSYDKKHALEGRAAIVGGGVMMAIGLGLLVMMPFYILCALGLW